MYFESVVRVIREMESPGVYLDKGGKWDIIDLTLDEYLADDWYFTEDNDGTLSVRRESWPKVASIRPKPQS